RLHRSAVRLFSVVSAVIKPFGEVIQRLGYPARYLASQFFKFRKPFLESWIKDQVGIPALTRALKEKAPFWVEKMPEIPELVYDS
ncbi:hypothetical protein MJN47_31745, partial [Salmonella enterica subsp. enterica serovar Lubbock]|nr:hypothetical protein [Salmonella enterica subsp. enterica serovar Lubbock]